MKDIIITYNLDGGDDQYEEVGRAIRALGKAWHSRLTFDSVWWLKTNKRLRASPRLDLVTPHGKGPSVRW